MQLTREEIAEDLNRRGGGMDAFMNARVASEFETTAISIALRYYKKGLEEADARDSERDTIASLLCCMFPDSRLMQVTSDAGKELLRLAIELALERHPELIGFTGRDTIPIAVRECLATIQQQSETFDYFDQTLYIMNIKGKLFGLPDVHLPETSLEDAVYLQRESVRVLGKERQ